MIGKSKIDRILSILDFFEVNGGFIHSFEHNYDNDFNQGKMFKSNTPTSFNTYKMFKSHIPKGSLYYYNETYGEYASTSLIIDDKKEVQEGDVLLAFKSSISIDVFIDVLNKLKDKFL